MFLRGLKQDPLSTGYLFVLKYAQFNIWLVLEKIAAHSAPSEQGFSNPSIPTLENQFTYVSGAIVKPKLVTAKYMDYESMTLVDKSSSTIHPTG